MEKNFITRLFNRGLHILARNLPGAKTIRPFLHRLRGVNIHGNVFIGDQVYIENEYPECVEINDETQIGIRSIIIAHLRGPGKVVIGKKVWIGPNCVIAAADGRTLRIGDDAVIAASTTVTSNVPPGILISSERGVPIAKVTIPWTEETAYTDSIRGLIPLRKEKKQ